MEWYTFIEKIPKRNEPIFICISGVNRAKDNNAPVLNPTYQCVFAGTYDSVIFLQKMYEVTDSGYPMDKKRNRRRNEMRIYFDADNEYRQYQDGIFNQCG